MRNQTINDPTQIAILPHLKVTEELLSLAIRHETGVIGNAEIIAMSDLGLASNFIRMRGGFFTGMYAQWHSTTPFVPIDATINSCGVYIFTLKDVLDRDSFVKLINSAKKQIKTLGYTWNFERGNHFLTVGVLDTGEPCVVMHASADEYKKQNSDALYPTAKSWYLDSIKVYYSNSVKGRYLRYIVGSKAERFIEIASSIEVKNKKRMQEISSLIFGNLIKSECLFVSHYGMPTNSSLAIGCSWKQDCFALLTAPQKNIYIIDPQVTEKDNGSKVTPDLYPHGLGIEIEDPVIYYQKGLMTINGITINSDDTVVHQPNRKVRMCDAPDNDIYHFVQRISDERGYKVKHVIKPLMSINRTGLI